MIKLFKHVRKSLLEEKQMGKYLKYAIGEIVLVMIGILLALQVNNWNNKRIEAKEEKEVIAKLHTEFKENKLILSNYITALKGEINAYSTLINLVGVSKEEIAKHNIDSIFYSAFGATELAFADNTIKNLLQSGKLNLLKKDKITDLLYKWNTLSEIRKTRLAKLDEWTNSYFVPYLLSKISFKEMDSFGNYDWTGKSKIKPNYLLLFQEIEFENYLENSLWFHHQVKERCLETEKIIDEIITITKM